MFMNIDRGFTFSNIFTIILVLIMVQAIHGFMELEGLYCGKENCYDVLGVPRESSKSDIARAYRRLARKYHPDMHRSTEAKKKAEERFTQLATAYEILRDEESRADYDYMLDNPDEVYRHYYRYYRRRVAPKVDVRIVLAVTITVISVVQYWGAWSRYKAAVDYLVTVPKYRLKAVDIAKQEGLLNSSKKKDRRPKEVIKEEEEAILKKVLEEKVDIKGGYSKPSIKDILWIQLILLPYTIGAYIVWYFKWVWKFNICKEEFGEEEKFYLIRKKLKCNESQWNSIEEEEKLFYLKKELWKEENFKVWKKQKEDEMKAKLAENAKYKSYRRYMRNHGPGQITFED
ncbi:dnaJ homolog subfamily C member 25 homolog [Limulus polyphemus]|uniref:DnaJ homolog subfamily C member 25 homolog n=1 Tax=Limulus polyphemus TaxID=6850 RepID=A0ABM1C4F1_LIMPO|nr:dnaJ homolog subfamily C member 25 homolog [Limulus polyphemus]